MARPNWEYVRVDVLMPTNPKVCGLGLASRWLLIELWCYCGQHLSDGFVPDVVWRRTGRIRDRKPLLDQGFAYRVQGGYQMHDFLEHQRSRAEVEDLREKRRKAGEKGGHATASKPDGSHTEAKLKPQLEHNSSQGDATTEATPGPVDNSNSLVTDPASQQTPKQVLQQTPSKSPSKQAAEAEAEAEADRSVADVVHRVNGSKHAPSDLNSMIMQEIRTATGKHVSAEWAAKIAAHILDGRSPADPAAYVRQAIRNEPNPGKRFLPIY